MKKKDVVTYGLPVTYHKLVNDYNLRLMLVKLNGTDKEVEMVRKYIKWDMKQVESNMTNEDLEGLGEMEFDSLDDFRQVEMDKLERQVYALPETERVNWINNRIHWLP